jgi:pyruvate/2-oxoglutarate/acetoin dehydrogenase E1 component
VMPSTATDARDLLIAAVLSDDPVLYLDDRWLYGLEDVLADPAPINLADERPHLSRSGSDLTLVGCGFTSMLCREAAARLSADGVECDVVDIRVLNPLDPRIIIESVQRTGRLLAVDGDWASCGMAAEVIAAVCEAVEPGAMRERPRRLTLPAAPAPTSRALESSYYLTTDDVVREALSIARVLPPTAQ